MTRDDYWKECIAVAADECGAQLTPEQIDYMAGAVSGGHECYRMAFGHDVASSNWHAANEREKDGLRKAVTHEREKVVCPDCGGRGRLIYNAGPWGVNTGCSKCSGDGKVHPTRL